MDGWWDVLFFCPDDGGGAQRTVINLANRLPRDRYRGLGRRRAMRRSHARLVDEVSLIDLGAGRARHAISLFRRIEKPAPDILLTILDANIVAKAANRGLRPRPCRSSERPACGRVAISGWSPAIGVLAYAGADVLVALFPASGRELAADFSFLPNVFERSGTRRFQRRYAGRRHRLLRSSLSTASPSLRPDACTARKVSSTF